MTDSKMSITKIKILTYCIEPKQWYELRNFLNRAKSTMSEHLNKLIDQKFLDKTDHYYQTTKTGRKYCRTLEKINTFEKQAEELGVSLE